MAQIARPVSDISSGSGGWTVVPASPTTIWDKLDETVLDGATSYVWQLFLLNSDFFEVKLSSLTNPVTNAGHVLRVGVNQNSDPADVQFAVMQGATQIALFDDPGTIGFEVHTFALSEAQASTITDYTDLRVQVLCHEAFANQFECDISFIEFEVPNFVPATNWKINDSAPASLAMEFAPPAAAWSVVYWGPGPLAFNASVGAQSITGAGQIASAEVQGQPAVSASIAAAGIATGEAQGQPVIRATVAAVALSSAEALGQPAVAASVATAGIASGEAPGAPDIAALVTTVAISSAEALGAPDVSVPQAIVDAGGIASAEAFGQPDISALAEQQIVDAGGIPSSEAVGAPLVSVASAELSFGAGPLGRPVDLPRKATRPRRILMDVGGIASEEAFGAPSISLAPMPPPAGGQYLRSRARREEELLRIAA